MSIYHNQTNVAPGTAFYSSGGGGGGSNDPNPVVSTITTKSVIGVSTMTMNTYVASGTPNAIPIDNYMLVQNASQGGRNTIRTTWDATDTGAVVSCVVGADGTNGTAFIGSEWPGYITMPMTIYGANISLVSDNETFMFCDGAAGAIGTISTGTRMLSAQNTFSTITDPSNQYQANMTALLSTLKSQYPACFS